MWVHAYAVHSGIKLLDPFSRESYDQLVADGIIGRKKERPRNPRKKPKRRRAKSASVSCRNPPSLVVVTTNAASAVPAGSTIPVALCATVDTQKVKLDNLAQPEAHSSCARLSYFPALPSIERFSRSLTLFHGGTLNRTTRFQTRRSRTRRRPPSPSLVAFTNTARRIKPESNTRSHLYFNC